MYGPRKSQCYQAQGPDTIAPPKGQGLIPRASPFEEIYLEYPVCILGLIHVQLAVPREVDNVLDNLVSRLLGKPLGISIPNILRRWESFPRPLSPKHPLRTDNIGPHYRACLFKLEPSSKATITIFHYHLSNHLEQIVLDL